MLKTYLNVTALVTGRNFTKRRILCAGSLVECAAWSWWRPGAGHLRRVQEAHRCQHVSWACGCVVADLEIMLREMPFQCYEASTYPSNDETGVSEGEVQPAGAVCSPAHVLEPVQHQFQRAASGRGLRA